MPDLSVLEIIVAVATVLGVGKILELLVSRLLNRKIHVVTEEKLKAEVEQLEITNNKTEVDVVRAVLEEVREHSATKDKRIDTLEGTVFRLEGRIERMEAREHQAHQLTAAHEAWDLKTYQLVLLHHPEHPDPPPLRAPLLIEAHIDTEERHTHVDIQEY